MENNENCILLIQKIKTFDNKYAEEQVYFEI